jgi:HD-like signal output (HDOD) protein
VRTTDVLEELQKLPLRPSAVSHALVVLDNPEASALEVANALQSDPSLCARLLHLANSPYFGLSGKVTSAERAIIALGNSVVRSLAVSTAAGMFSESPDSMPPGFWDHSIAVAAGASVAARTCGLAAGDAMCAGLMHDLGAALLYRLDRVDYSTRLAAGTPKPFVTMKPRRTAATMRRSARLRSTRGSCRSPSSRRCGCITRARSMSATSWRAP